MLSAQVWALTRSLTAVDGHAIAARLSTLHGLNTYTSRSLRRVLGIAKEGVVFG